MAEMERFDGSIPSPLLRSLDQLIRQKGYQNRSEAIRDLIRDSPVKREWESEAMTVGTITIVDSHHPRELSKVLTERQHRFYQTIISTAHIHLDEDNGLEVLIVKGKGIALKKIRDRLSGTKGLKHGNLSLCTSGRGLH